ncbi:MAG: hypothetical protein AB1404_06110 [Spirochaetota bacterium]
MVNSNYFINSYKYVKTEESSQLENFSTETFVFILKYLIKEFPEYAKKILSLFGFNNISNDDINNIHIETQKSFYIPENFVDINKIPIKQKEARPDIAIWFNSNEIILIEVKVDAGLNWYTLQNKSQIDQIEFYSNIKNCKDVYVLSKHTIDINYPNNKLIRWFNIYEILKTINSFIIKEYLYFLERNNMGERLKIDNNVLNILDKIKALDNLLKNSWEAANIKGYKLNSYSFINELGFGYFILKNNEKSSAAKEFPYFIGINLIVENKEKYANKIVFWVSADSIDIKKKDSFDYFECGYISKNNIELSELIKLDSVDEQEKALRDWLIKEVMPLLE